MSYAYFHGVIPVSDGRRVQTIRGNGSVVWHTVYDSMFLTESRDEVDGLFRAFSPASESILITNSLLFVHGKFALPCGLDGVKPSDFLIESIHHNVFAVDPTQDGYDSFLPVDNVPSVSLLGNVVGGVIHMGDNAKAVDIRVGSYIHGRNIDCIYRCV